jgi:hypothetical protein
MPTQTHTSSPAPTATPTPTPTPTVTSTPVSTPTPTPTPTPSPTSSSSAVNNVMNVTVNGSLCGGNSAQYPNEPCVSVTICAPGTSNCQTIDNILLDTGSYGLRVFQSVLSVPVTPVTTSQGNLAECVQFGDGSSEWGEVAMANVQIANEPSVQIPIHVVNSTYANPPAPCSSSQSTPDTGPSETGFNGILGVGLFAQDCGSYCVSNANSEQYYVCSGSSCNGSTASLANQVINPVAALPVDNNGVIVELPSVSANGEPSLSGSVILGIGTESNNSASGATAYAADSSGEFGTVFSAYSSSELPAFIDSGSSVWFVPPISSLPDCSASHGSGWSGWYCPSSTQSLSASTVSATGSPQNSVSFQLGNAYSLLNDGNNVYSNIGAESSSGSNAYFDWGIPFFYGRNVYVGIQGASSSLGTGPYWAY